MRTALIGAAIALLSAGTFGGRVFATCGFCDPYPGSVGGCAGNKDHNFWAVISYHENAHDGWHEDPECGECNVHSDCPPNFAAATQDVAQALNDGGKLATVVSKHSEFVRVDAEAKTLVVLDCAGNAGKVYNLTKAHLDAIANFRRS